MHRRVASPPSSALLENGGCPGRSAAAGYVGVLAAGGHGAVGCPLHVRDHLEHGRLRGSPAPVVGWRTDHIVPTPRVSYPLSAPSPDGGGRGRFAGCSVGIEDKPAGGRAHGLTEQILADVTCGTVGADRMATTERTAIPASPQAAGPAVPESDIGAGGVPGCSGMPGTWKWQPARQSWRIPGPGHRRTPWRLRCRHGEDRPMGAGKPSLERPRNHRRFPPLGATQMASQRWPTYNKGGHLGGPLFGHPKRDSLRGRST